MMLNSRPNRDLEKDLRASNTQLEHVHSRGLTIGMLGLSRTWSGMDRFALLYIYKVSTGFASWMKIYFFMY